MHNIHNLVERRGGLGKIKAATLKEPELILVERNKHVLCLAVVVKHHLVRLPAETRLFIATEGRVCGVCMVAVHLSYFVQMEVSTTASLSTAAVARAQTRPASMARGT